MTEENESTSNLVGDCSRCVKCGTCQFVCPVFSVRPEESMTPRGKMALVEAVSQGHLDGTRRYKEYLETCLLCGACEEACPNDVQTLSVMFRGRENIPGRIRLQTLKGLVLKYLLGTANLFRYAMKAGRTFQYFIFRKVPSSSGMRRRFPMPVITSDRTIPVLSRRFFRDHNRGQITEGPGPRVGLFTGCAGNYFYTDVSEAMVFILDWLGATIVVPPEQACCGLPALAGGALTTARDLALKNLEAFEKYDLGTIVTGCATCGSNLTHNYTDLLTRAGVEEERAEKFQSSIMDINVFLYRSDLIARLGELEDDDQEPLKVTYHHPCHLGRQQGIKEEPVELIRAMPGVEYVPMDEADRCCGLGGSFGVEHYDMSREVNDRKIRNIAETGADVIVTSCPGCIMHIRDGLRRNGHESIEALHIMVLLERRLKAVTALKGEGEGEEVRAAG